MLPGKQYTFDDIARIAWRGKWLVLAPAIVTSVLAATYLRFVPDVFRADTTILVVVQRAADASAETAAAWLGSDTSRSSQTTWEGSASAARSAAGSRCSLMVPSDRQRIGAGSGSAIGPVGETASVLGIGRG